MAEMNFYCSAEQGFNFKKDEQVVVGHLLTCKVGDQKLEADLEVTDPEDNTKNVSVVGVMTSISWAGGYAQPIMLDCQVSNKNKVSLASLTMKTLSSTNLNLAFNIYNYDPAAKKYFKAFHTDGKDLNALILKSGGSLAIQIATEASSEVESPKNFSFGLGAMPMEQSQEQQVFLATSVTNKLVMRWGVPVK